MLNQGALARHVTLVHATDLRHRHVRLVDHQQEVLSKIVQQTVRCGAGLASIDMPGVVLDSGAGADLTHHLEVITGTHPQPLRFQQLAAGFQFGQPQSQLGLNIVDRPLHALRAGHVVRRWEDVDLAVLAKHFTTDRLQCGKRLDLIAKELHPDGMLFIHREDLNGVTAYPESTAGASQIIAGVLNVD